MLPGERRVVGYNPFFNNREALYGIFPVTGVCFLELVWEGIYAGLKAVQEIPVFVLWSSHTFASFSAITHCFSCPAQIFPVDRLGKNITIACLFYCGIDVPGAVEPFVSDLHGFPGNFIAGLHFLNHPADIGLLGFIPRIHLHGQRHQVCIEEERLANDRPMLIFLGRAFLLVPAGKIDLKVIVRAVKEAFAEIPPVILLVAVVKELNIFFVRPANECQAIVNLVL